MNVSFRYFLDLFPLLYISIDNINSFYFYDTGHWDNILSVSQNNICRKQGVAVSGRTAVMWSKQWKTAV